MKLQSAVTKSSHHQWLPFLLLILFSTSISAAFPHEKIPRLISRDLRVPEKNTLDKTAAAETTNSDDQFKTYYYRQTIDHFNFKPESYATFKQRYAIKFKDWGGANSSSPIFAFLGEEQSLDPHLSGVGFLNDNAPKFKALQVYMEHRFYGKSVPFGTMEEAMRNNETRGYFNSAQAIADYAEILLYVRKTLSAQNSPIIVFGASYGGMLASWFRLKYPHIALGALASSAPILYFNNITPMNGYFSVVTRSFKESSLSCYKRIHNSWSLIDKIASKPNGLAMLSAKFKSCSPLNSSSDLKMYLESMYAEVAQYNQPPSYPVNIVCGGIDGKQYHRSKNLLDRIFGGVVAYTGNRTCYNYVSSNTPPSETAIGWSWQTCSEMVIPIGIGKGTMFQKAPFSLAAFIDECKSVYGVLPRPHWITTYYGGHDIKLVLQRFASNIIFSNGLKDPYSSGGVLEDISETLVAVTTVNGSHCLDILAERKDDPDWLTIQRKQEVDIIHGWLKQYYTDLLAYKK